MLYIFLSILALSLDDNDPLISQDIVNQINNNHNSTFKAHLNNQFVNMTIADSKRFLSPVFPNSYQKRSPNLYNVDFSDYQNFTNVITGYTNENLKFSGYKLSIYNNQYFCSSWVTAVTSAMSLALSIHSKKNINLSVQFIIDCDFLGDSCIERPGFNSYEPFYKRFIPQVDQWDQQENVLRSPPENLTDEICDSKYGCFPNWEKCQRNQVLSGSCNTSSLNSNCPVYFLNNWKWMQKHLWEIGPITSSIFVKRSLFTYSGGIYSLETSGNDPIIGMMDVTIIGWGQENSSTSMPGQKWWYVIPHLGTDFGESAGVLFNKKERDALGFSNPNQKTGIMRFKRCSDDFGIESQSIGAIPFNFVYDSIRNQNNH